MYEIYQNDEKCAISGSEYELCKLKHSNIFSKVKFLEIRVKNNVFENFFIIK